MRRVIAVLLALTMVLGFAPTIEAEGNNTVIDTSVELIYINDKYTALVFTVEPSDRQEKDELGNTIPVKNIKFIAEVDKGSSIWPNFSDSLLFNPHGKNSAYGYSFYYGHAIKFNAFAEGANFIAQDIDNFGSRGTTQNALFYIDTGEELPFYTNSDRLVYYKLYRNEEIPKEGLNVTITQYEDGMDRAVKTTYNLAKEDTINHSIISSTAAFIVGANNIFIKQPLAEEELEFKQISSSMSIDKIDSIRAKIKKNAKIEFVDPSKIDIKSLKSEDEGETDSSTDSTNSSKKIYFYINQNYYEEDVEGEIKKVEMDVKTSAVNGRTMLPIRYVAEAIGAGVEWKKESKSAVFSKDGIIATVALGEKEIKVSDGRTITMDAEPTIVESRIMVPLTNISQIFNMTNGDLRDEVEQDIEWDSENKRVIINVK